MTHKELVNKAFEWAKGRYPIVLKERVSGWGEIPDVLGINLSESTMIECKASRADFHRDKKKLSRITGDMPGNYRLYCAPKGLLKDEDIPEGWGLLEVYPSGYVKQKRNIFSGLDTSWHKYHHPLSNQGFKSERHSLFSAIRDYAWGIEKDKIYLFNLSPQAMKEEREAQTNK
jgi:hypothetical protein